MLIRPHPGAMAVFGALKPSVDKKNIPFKEARAKAREARVDEIAKEGRR